MKIGCMIPIKAHSERVTGKSFRDLGGKKLAQWIVDALDKCPYDIDIWINTDSQEVADMFTEYRNVAIYHRSDYLHGDGVSMNIILQDWMESVRKHKNYACFLQTHITNPFLTADSIEAALDAYFTTVREDSNDSVMGVTGHQCRMWYMGEPVNFIDNSLIKTQDLVPVYEDNSCIYVFSRESFYNNSRNRVGLKPFLFEVEFPENIDIDTEDDFKIAQLVVDLLE